jgi:twitching motility two-component system response regulator PilH
MAHVLVVDDSPTEAHAMEQALKQGGHMVSAVDSGEKGLAKARELRPDLILMDILMPGMNGFQTVRRIRRDPAIANIPIVMVSVKSDTSDKAWALRQGAKDYVTKPFNPDELLEVVTRTLGAGD